VVTVAPAWHALTATVVGPKHRSVGRGGQDAAGSRSVEGGHVIAVADGHGSERCYRADRGADLAVQTALEVLSRPNVHADAVPAAIVNAWRAAVSTDVGAHPFGTLAADPDSEEAEPYTAYGTTLLAAVARVDAVLLVQLGDGEMLVAGAGADGARRALPPDPLLAADMTTSLALDDAADHMRVSRLDRARESIDLLVLATDGYANAFADDAAFAQVASDLRRWLVMRDPAWMAGELPGWLEQSAGITGDDASLGLLYRWPLPPPPAS
jgi:hypothetical protein